MVQWVEVILALLGGGSLGSVTTFLIEKRRVRIESAKVRSDIQGEVTKHYEVLVGRLEKRIEVLETRINDLEGRLQRAYDCDAGARCPVLGEIKNEI